MSESVIVDKKINKLDNQFVVILLKNKKSLIIFFIAIFIIIILYINIATYNKNTVSKKINDEKIKEGYKPHRVRTDPYDEYDLKTEIDELLNKQEKYLEKINK